MGSCLTMPRPNSPETQFLTRNAVSLPNTVDSNKLYPYATMPAPAVERTIRILHIVSYAEPNDWSRPILLGESGSATLAALFRAQPGEIVRVLIKHLLME